MESKNCECCGKLVEIRFGATKYCSKCARHNNFQSELISRLKGRVEYLQYQLSKHNKVYKHKK